MAWKSRVIDWVEIHWPRPFDAEVALTLLVRLAAIDRFSQVVFEVRAHKGCIRYLLGAEDSLLRRIKQVMISEISGVEFSERVARADVTATKNIRLSHPTLALNTACQLSVIRSVLATLAQTKGEQNEIVMQIILGKSFTPSLLPEKLSDPRSSWLDMLRGSVAPATSETRALIKEKVAHHGFATALRIGSVALDGDSNHLLPKALHDIRNVFSALKVIESAGARLRAVTDRPDNLNRARCPLIYPMRLSVKELIGFLVWPLGDEDFRGIREIHPKVLLAPARYRGDGRTFGLASGFQDNRKSLAITARDSLEHTILLGPTGSGKSTAMLNLILADILAGRSVLVIDPKYDLVNDILARTPPSRLDDVVVLDPTDASPVGFNPLMDKTRSSSLVADAILAVFKTIFSDSWGIRTEDILSAAILTLVRYGQECGGVSLIWLPTLLTDATFRQRIVGKVAPEDPLGLGAFWAGFEALSVAQRNVHIAPVLNKLRQFLLRPELRAVLGQNRPKFSLSDLFYSQTGRKIVLVPLNKGTIGTETARLLGSLIVGQFWTLALSRAGLSPEKRHIVDAYIDEVQDYLALPTNLADALSQARGLGVGLTVAHQYRAQLPPALKAGIDANARNKIIFGLNATDAKDMAQMATLEKLEALDFMLLPRFGVYANLQERGRQTGWISGSTLPAPPSTISAAEVRAKSQMKYGTDAKTTEQAFLDMLGYSKVATGKKVDMPIGRKRRTQNEK